MSNSRPIVILENDIDDQYLMETIIREIGLTNEIRFFPNGEEGLHYLKTTTEQPLLIICDVNMPKVDGVELKLAIDQDPMLKEKNIPFVFLSTSASYKNIQKLHAITTVQGYFIKPAAYKELKDTVRKILDYWASSIIPGAE